MITRDGTVTNHIRCAEAFLEAHSRCDPEAELEDQSKIALPAIVCGAFASEVALKTLLLLHGKKQHGHDLVALFSKLPAHLRSQILEGTCLTEAKFNRELENARNAFIEWRYFYESENFLMVNVGFLGQLASVTLAIVHRVENAA